MNGKQRKTLEQVFAKPTNPGIAWNDIERLLVGCGCRVIEGSGSRVKFELNGIVATFHRPHPTKEAKRYQVEDARNFLGALGIRP